MKTTIGPMLCKLNTEHATIPELAERRAAAEAEQRRAAERETAARKEREAAKAAALAATKSQRAAEREAAARREREEAQRKEREQAVARKRQQEKTKARASAAGKKLRSTVKTVLAIMAMVLLLSAVVGAAYGLDQGLTYVVDQIPFLWKDATCTEPAVNVLTKDTRGEPAGHTYPICAVCGENHKEAKDHFWDPSNCTEGGVCSVCGETVEARGHNFEPDHEDEYAYCRDCGTLTSVWLRNVDEQGFHMNGYETDYWEAEQIIPPLSSMTLEGAMNTNSEAALRSHDAIAYTVYVRTTDGVWQAAGSITKDIDPAAAVESNQYTIRFDTPVAFDAMCVVPADSQIEAGAIGESYVGTEAYYGIYIENIVSAQRSK